ncbi:hypothetical protein, partial [Pseudomonas protegens]
SRKTAHSQLLYRGVKKTMRTILLIRD